MCDRYPNPVTDSCQSAVANDAPLSPEAVLAKLLYRELGVPYPLSPGAVKSLIFSKWETLKTLAHQIHDSDRRKRSRDRRA